MAESGDPPTDTDAAPLVKELPRFPDLQPVIPENHRLKSTFGTQVLSYHATEPRTAFGRADRVKADKMYISAEMSKSLPGTSPGPCYELPSTMGKQPVSTLENEPDYVFDHANRFKYGGKYQPGPGAYNIPSGFGEQVLSYQKTFETPVIGTAKRNEAQKIYMSSDFDKVKFGVESPGPVVCDPRSSLGTQLHSVNPTSPHFRLGHEKRFKYPGGRAPGAGQYESIGSVGRQPLSRNGTLPAFRFPKCTRDAGEKRFISREHDKSRYGVDSPGPASSVKHVPSVGHQPDSRKYSASAWKFPSATRFKRMESEVPGPGAYDVGS